MESFVVKGKVWKFGNDVNTDVIYPGRFLNVTDPQESAKHCFEVVYPNFMKDAKAGDIIVAGKYFGCGSSREQAAACLKNFGLAAVVAESFARIYYRNAINLGLPILICPEISKKVEQGQEIEVNLREGIVKNLNTGKNIKAIPLPAFVLEMLESGGLIPHLKKKLKK
ncbi:MAG: 3-isopropylmalate dehydratase small subunit [Candidatus Edwardsbacteria bacterium]